MNRPVSISHAVSYTHLFAHLRRLFVEEHRRLVKLEEEQLRNLGMHPDSIRERVENKDPADRLGADDLAEEEEQTS